MRIIIENEIDCFRAMNYNKNARKLIILILLLLM